MSALAHRAPIGLLLALATTACSEHPLTTGLTEPISVQGAQFVEGDLPGLPPLSSEDIVNGVEPEKPSARTPAIELSNLQPGTPAVRFSGQVTDDALSIGVKLKGEGTGYWLLPSRDVDVTDPNFLTYDFLADFHEFVEPGPHVLEVAAFDADGHSGNKAETNICLGSLIPDNGNACEPTKQPPDLVVTLSWDGPADLDLIVVTPSGKVVDSRNPSTADPDEEGVVDPNQPGVGNLEFDSNRACVIDGAQREHLVFQTVPTQARYHIYANLNRACDTDSVRFDLTYHGRVPGKEAGTFDVESDVKLTGTLIAAQANGGRQLGTFLTDLKIGAN
ncbi:MAG TPA: hypothetical protein VLC09_00430 [Polyangiaceae bacterium]|nr:hypothetical protein [Polyangiaceae bacterium]